LGWIYLFDHLIAFMHTYRDALFVHSVNLFHTYPFCLQSGLSLSGEGILGPLSSDLPPEGVNLTEVPLAEES